ncbi:hypothetical protein M427DRAFT_135502 [Gonapodya prolifera JEL478]|uniref:SH3 domain-containing protein n=1 Tax=Gonapodya prolifera (strain JEL478) TaxID=1344416 RepID=A0A139ADH9_GONPJ|nr:hypothetical protein M427DRAFT_135502 [Gonapodya prolifera JEL478]|eukprot:KXS14808.1 hypothetical protein M427DRAFT_135502 [Gonapodya prolifera JEL478]
MAPKKLTVQHWEGNKKLLLKDGQIPASFCEFQTMLATRVGALAGLTQRGQLKFTYCVEGESETLDLEDDDDLELMLDAGDSLVVRVTRAGNVVSSQVLTPQTSSVLDSTVRVTTSSVLPIPQQPNADAQQQQPPPPLDTSSISSRDPAAPQPSQAADDFPTRSASLNSPNQMLPSESQQQADEPEYAHVPINTPVRVVNAYSRNPDEPDEIDIGEGDTVTICAKFDDGWGRGYNHATRAEGIFPCEFILGIRHEERGVQPSRAVGLLPNAPPAVDRGPSPTYGSRPAPPPPTGPLPSNEIRSFPAPQPFPSGSGLHPNDGLPGSVYIPFSVAQPLPGPSYNNFPPAPAPSPLGAAPLRPYNPPPPRGASQTQPPNSGYPGSYNPSAPHQSFAPPGPPVPQYNQPKPQAPAYPPPPTGHWASMSGGPQGTPYGAPQPGGYNYPPPQNQPRPYGQGVPVGYPSPPPSYGGQAAQQMGGYGAPPPGQVPYNSPPHQGSLLQPGSGQRQPMPGSGGYPAAFPNAPYSGGVPTLPLPPSGGHPTHPTSAPTSWSSNASSGSGQLAAPLSNRSIVSNTSVASLSLTIPSPGLPPVSLSLNFVPSSASPETIMGILAGTEWATQRMWGYKLARADMGTMSMRYVAREKDVGKNSGSGRVGVVSFTIFFASLPLYNTASESYTTKTENLHPPTFVSHFVRTPALAKLVDTEWACLAPPREWIKPTTGDLSVAYVVKAQKDNWGEQAKARVELWARANAERGDWAQARAAIQAARGR